MAQSDGHDAPGLGDELVPGLAALVEDVGIGLEDPVAEPVLAHELPEVFDRVQFGRFRRQGQQGDVAWDLKRLREVPSGLVDDDDAMSAGRDRGRDLPEMERHRRGITFWQYQGRTDAPSRADGPKDIGGAGALILGSDGARSALRPAPGDLVLLADPGLVLPPNLYGRAWGEPALDLRHPGREAFLNVA